MYKIVFSKEKKTPFILSFLNAKNMNHNIENWKLKTEESEESFVKKNIYTENDDDYKL